MALYAVALLFGTRVAETILASVHVRAHPQAGHMDASNLIKALQNTLRGGGRPHMANAIRGHAAEFGLTAAKGMAHLVPLLDRIQADESLPALARELFALQAKEYIQLQVQIKEIDAKLTAWHRADECSQRLAKIPGVGPIGAVLLTMKTPDPELFQSGRQFAAWIGLTPKDHSTAGKVRLGVITRAGDEGLRSVLVVGATAVIQQAQRSGKASPWLAALLKRKSPKLAAVAVADCKHRRSGPQSSPRPAHIDCNWPGPSDP